MIRALYAAGSVTPAQDSRPERWLARRETNVDLQIRAAGKTGSVCALSYSVSPRFIMKGECKLQTGTHSPQKSAADSSAWTYSITTKDIQDVALSLLDRELTNDEFLTATKYFENGIQWWDVAENAVDLALEDHRMITS